ncbi:TetR family transcriptional regulator [Streptomyces sp. WMMB 322]|uniref:TetR family transcriptional regulator n=1 Tax=Streptomyces sp. WMMB 322 TaxID=1286821 RepID=UPI0006E3F6A5|nr:TetR family transcriptional regulator [Streptomyces sp. WMMB 322]SCK15302.1 transcriptional regulator, TetR family [Streptomyces sp. WMMB 322]
MTLQTPPPDPRPTLRERKKQRARRELVETALRLFLDRGFEATTLDELVDAAELSKRTFFRMFSSKETVALAAETDLWDAYLERVEQSELRGTVLHVLRDTLVETIRAMDGEWTRRFLATRGLAARTPALRDRSDLTSITIQRRLVEILERRLGLDSRDDVRLRLLGEMSLGAWRCAARNWIRGGSGTRPGAEAQGELVDEVEQAFDALPACLALSAS